MHGRATVRERGFTLIELMIVVAIIGVLAALAVLGVRRYLAASKTTEAKHAVGAIARHAVTQYERERNIAELLAATGQVAANTHLLCASASPVPTLFNMVQGTKYQPSSVAGDDFLSGTTLAGWQCLGFSIAHPIYYRYQYLVGAGYVSQSITGAPLPTLPEAFEASAQGDLDGDGTRSTFTRVGEVRNGQVVMSTNVFIDEEFE